MIRINVRGYLTPPPQALTRVVTTQCSSTHTRRRPFIIEPTATFALRELRELRSNLPAPSVDSPALVRVFYGDVGAGQLVCCLLMQQQLVPSILFVPVSFNTQIFQSVGYYM